MSTDSLVWREGWRDWQEASKVFPHFGASEVVARFEGVTTGMTSPPNLDTTPNATVERTTTAWHPKTVQAAIISALMLAIIILLAVFMFVLFREPEKTSLQLENPQQHGQFDRAVEGAPPLPHT